MHRISNLHKKTRPQVCYKKYWQYHHSHHSLNAWSNHSKIIHSLIHQAVLFCFPTLSFPSTLSMPFLSYLVVRRSRTQTTWNCTVLSRTQIPWGAGVGWASWASTQGCQWGARCPRCTPTVTGQRAPGRQTCPQCVRPCAAEHPQNNPCSAWWSPRRSLAQAWWSGLKVPHRLAARGRG